MRKWIVAGLAMLGVASAGPLEAQLDGRLSAEPYVGYGFFGSLPDTDFELEGDLTIGGRVGYQMSPQWGVFGTFQRSTPELTSKVSDVELSHGDLDVDHWSVGAEFSYVPRGGAERMLPILLEAGLGQARYSDGWGSDFAVNLGIASALELSPRLAVRYGANDYISNFDGNGMVNQIFVRVGAEFTF